MDSKGGEQVIVKLVFKNKEELDRLILMKSINVVKGYM